MPCFRLISCVIFLSSLPARGATAAGDAGDGQIQVFLSSLPARGATFGLRHLLRCFAISILAPREGSDVIFRVVVVTAIIISILAPREGSDIPAACCSSTHCYFYPRSPRGERLMIYLILSFFWTFLSSLPARGATSAFCNSSDVSVISILAPREGSDQPFPAYIPA